MAEQSTTNSIHPQDGNQIVIGENHATITINNYNKENNENDLQEKMNNFMQSLQMFFENKVIKKRKSK